MVPVDKVAQQILTGLAAATGKPVGDSVTPDDDSLPYAVLYRLPGGGPFSSLDHGSQYAIVTFQVTSVGETARQAEWMKAAAREAMLDLSNFTAPAGFGFAHVNCDLDNGVNRDDDQGTEPLFYGIDRFRLWVVPS